MKPQSLMAILLSRPNSAKDPLASDPNFVPGCLKRYAEEQKRAIERKRFLTRLFIVSVLFVFALASYQVLSAALAEREFLQGLSK